MLGCRFVVTLCVVLTNLNLLIADDWPRWMGPTADGVYREKGTVKSLPASGLKVNWRVPVSGGYAGPAVVENRVYVFDYQKTAGTVVNSPGERVSLDGKERLLCIDSKTGKTIWTYQYDCPYSISYPVGPRCTPTVDDGGPDDPGRVYILGSEGNLSCLNAATGELIWSRSFKTDFNAPVSLWGFASHPLVDGDLLYCMVGGPGQTVVAFDKFTGEVKWKALSAAAIGYCPPSIVSAGGDRQLMICHAEAIVGMEPQTGKELWTIPFKPDFEMAIARPQVAGSRVFASAIRNESLLFEFVDDQRMVKEIWRGEPKQAVHSANSTPIFFDGVIYGTDCNEGSLIAVDANNGDRLWTTFEVTNPKDKRRLNHGTAFVTQLGESDEYLLMSETGDLILAGLSPAGYNEKWRFHVLEPTSEAFGRDVVWSHPAYANNTAFVRNDAELVSVSLDQ